MKGGKKERTSWKLLLFLDLTDVIQCTLLIGGKDCGVDSQKGKVLAISRPFFFPIINPSHRLLHSTQPTVLCFARYLPFFFFFFFLPLFKHSGLVCLISSWQLQMSATCLTCPLRANLDLIRNRKWQKNDQVSNLSSFQYLNEC